MLNTVYTSVEGGPRDGLRYYRPKDETVASADDGVWLYRYELDDRSRMVWTGERQPLALSGLRRDLETATA